MFFRGKQPYLLRNDSLFGARIINAGTREAETDRAKKGEKQTVPVNRNILFAGNDSNIFPLETLKGSFHDTTGSRSAALQGQESVSYQPDRQKRVL